MKDEKCRRGSRAIHALQQASYFANRESHGPVDEITNRAEVARALSEAQTNLEPTEELIRGAGEAALIDSQDAESRLANDWLIHTLEHPNMIGVNASEQRMQAAEVAGVLEAAADAAESAQAGNSLEKMLCHQMAATHFAAMKLLARAANAYTNLPPVETARLTNAAARMMDVYQAGFLALQKIKTGGKQIVVVQHVQVSEGGQAVIAGNMKTGDGGSKRGGGPNND
jgi:hypothetical protein